MSNYTEEHRKFILNTLKPYLDDPTTVGINCGDGCSYLTEEGNKCAVGKHMKSGEWQESSTTYEWLISTYEPAEFLTDEAFKMNFKASTWSAMQDWHDSFARGDLHSFSSSVALSNLEKDTGLKFPELIVNNKN